MKALIRIMAALCVMSIASVALAQQRTRPETQAGLWQISGVVVDSINGQPLNGVSVLIAPVEHRDKTLSTRTGSDGRFTFQGLARAKYSLAANRRGYPAQGFNQHDAYTTAIVVGPDLDTEHIVFRLRPEATIRGKVTDEENDSVQNAMVRLFTTRISEGRLGTRMVRMTMTDDQGNYTFAHLPDGTYYVAVSGRPWYAVSGFANRDILLPAKQAGESSGTTDAAANTTKPEDERANLDKVFPLTFFRGALSSADATAIDLNPGESTTADMTLRAVPAVYLRIPRQQHPTPTPAEPNAQAPPPMMVSNISQPPRVELFHSLFEGTLLNADVSMVGGPDGFGISAAPGHYFAQISSGKESGTYQEIDLTTDMDLPSAAATTGTVAGMVEFDTTTPPGYLVLTLSNRLTGQQYGTRLTAPGEFRIDEPIIPGKYEVAVGNSPGWYLQSLSASGAKLSGRMLQISGSSRVRLSVKLGHGLALVDGVVMRDGKLWAGAMVVLVPRNAGNNSVLFRRDESDSDGTFTLRDVVPGTYNLVAIEDGWKLAWSDPKVLQPYLKSAEPLQLSPGAKTQATVQVQDR